MQLPWGEVVPSLAAGIIDAVNTSASSGVDGTFREFPTFMYPTSLVCGSNMVNLNLDAWNALEERDHMAIEEGAMRLEPQFWGVSRGEDEAKSALLNKNGVAMGEVTDAMLTGMQDATGPMTATFFKEHPKAQEVIDAFRAEPGG